uniref:NADH-ubiquinone oxidoreductase chain 4 n=1 Tax=Diartiger fossulatus TaxID=1535458 RepID=A0A0S2M740_9COLE|nr:NADH deshydrogenase subunit 4 [Diartiger fossulatus]
MMKVLFLMLFLIPLSFLNMYMYMYISFFVLFFMFFIMYINMDMVSMISYNYGLDMLSYMMILLSIWICGLMILASQNIYFSKYFFNFFLFTLVLMMISLYLTFCSLNLFLFYLFFEISLIPMLVFIMGWGYQPERLQAGIYLMFYTLVVSFPMMLSLFYCMMKFNSLMFFNFMMFDNLLFFFLMNMVFMVKIPMYLVHLWLPKAHVEAPISGSMILAGVMLKLGGYGIIRLMFMFVNIIYFSSIFIISLSMVGGLIVSLICLRQTDLKSLVAYSSVAHMGLVLSGLMTLNYLGLYGSFIMMLAHGLCSSGLFCLVNICYERIMSRSLYLIKGLINLFPNLSLWWFLLCSSNMAAPPSMNLLGEILLINSIVSWNYLTIFFLIFLSFFSACYSLFLYSYSQHGKFSLSMYSFSFINIREYLLVFLHWVPLNLFVLKFDLLLLCLNSL